MERVAFLIESSGQRLGCLLNPETLTVEREAGVQTRRSSGAPVTGLGLPDDAMLFTGGGVTHLRLDLLFDVTLAGSSVAASDVRELTAPLWNLAENIDGPEGAARPPRARFVWGKAWNIPVVVEAIAERLESFTPEGAPRRSWLRMRLRRAAEPAAPDRPEDLAPRPPVELAPGAPVSESQVRTEPVLGGRGDGGGSAERMDVLAQRYYGDPRMWRALAAFNGLDDPWRPPPDGTLRVPPRSAVRG